MDRKWKMGIVAAIIGGLSLTGCVDEDASVVMLGSVIGQATVDVIETEDEDGNVIDTNVSVTCDYPLDFDEPRVWSRGVINLEELGDTGQQRADGIRNRHDAVEQRPPDRYTFRAVFENRLFDSRSVGATSGGTGGGFEGLRLDKNDIIIDSATVDFASDANTFTVGDQVASFPGMTRERLTTMLVQSGDGVASMDVPIINGELEREAFQEFLREGLGVADDQFVTFVVDIQLHGETVGGTEVESNTYSFPIEMCANCTTATNGLCEE